MAEIVREMLISHDPSETRVGVLEDGKLVEFYIERAKRSVVGNVYLARVRDVLPGHAGGLRRHRAGEERVPLRGRGRLRPTASRTSRTATSRRCSSPGSRSWSRC